MARIMELCGSPGVGKSTIYNALMSKWTKTDNWIPADYLFPYVKSNYKWVYDFLKMFAKKDLRAADVRVLRNAGSRFISQYPEYIEACINHLLSDEKESLNGTDQRLEKASYIYDLIKMIQICRESSCDRIVILQEGLINGIRNALYKSESETNQKEEIIFLLNVMPLPDALIYVETDLNENINRLASRYKIIPSFEKLDRDQLLTIIQQLRIIWKTAINLLEERGIPVLYIDSSDPVSINASKIMSFSKSLDGNKLTARHSPM
jgi:hypothetical protein